MTTKAKGTSIRQKIIDLGKRLGVDPRDLETVFMIERGWSSAVNSIPNAMSFKNAFEKVVKLIGELEA